MYTSFVYFALAGVFANGSIPDEPLLHKNYSLARMQSVSVNKPIAVFIGSGSRGWEEVSQEGKLEKDVRKILSANYVCVYVDSSRGGGKDLANAFEVTEGTGLVISNRTGTIQAFHHAGTLSNEELASYLARYAEPDVVVQTTETKVPVQASYSGYYQQPVQQAPSYGYGYAPVFRGSRGC
jgi:hypothetical protein